MNIFRTYVKRNLKANRLRTIMTIIGITLSMALVTAVIEGGFSGLEYMRSVFKATYGDFHGYYAMLDDREMEELENDPEVESVAEYSTIGWAQTESINNAKPYLLIKDVSPDISNYLKFHIIEGRMPENGSELLISEHLDYNGGVSYKIGDKVTLTLGERAIDPTIQDCRYDTIRGNDGIILDESTPFQRAEYFLSKDETVTYTVVGIMDRLSYDIEDYQCPGYTAFTVDSGLKDSYERGRGAFFRLNDPSSFNYFVDSFNKHCSGKLHKNRELVAMYGGTTDRSYVLFFYGLVIILILLILFGTVALIYNAFSISVSERTKQIGILKSMGATKKQVRKMVFYEALFECGLAIPLGVALGCLGIGGTLYILSEGFSSFFGQYGGYEAAEALEIKLVVNIPLLITSVVIVIITTLFSAIIPALRASRISPLDAIRQSRDIRADGRIKRAGFIGKLFGIEGMLASKNYSRNKKKYRTTIVSLALSIILFIAAASFSSYIGGAADEEFYVGDIALVYYPGYPEDGDRDAYIKRTEEVVNSAQGVEDVIKARELYNLNGIEVDGIDDIRNEMKNYIQSETDTDTEYYTDLDFYNMSEVVFIDDESFKKLAEEEDISYNPDLTSMQAIVYNYGVINTYDIQSNRKKFEFSLVDESKLPLKAEISWYDYQLESDEGIVLTECIDKTGEVYVVSVEDVGLIDAFYEILNRDYSLGLEALESTANYKAFGPDDPASRFNPALTEKDIEILKSLKFEKKSNSLRSTNLDIIGTTNNRKYAFSSVPVVILAESAISSKVISSISEEEYYIYSSDSAFTEKDLNLKMQENKLDNSSLYNYDKSKENTKFLKKLINVFSFGFVILISLVSIANVFNTISTNVALRRREFGMLKSMGLSNKGVSKMLNIECLIYGVKSILLGLPIAFGVTYAVYRVTSRAFSTTFYIPVLSVLEAVFAVFIVVFVTMLYASKKIKKDNTIDVLKNDNV